MGKLRLPVFIIIFLWSYGIHSDFIGPDFTETARIIDEMIKNSAFCPAGPPTHHDPFEKFLVMFGTKAHVIRERVYLIHDSGLDKKWIEELECFLDLSRPHEPPSLEHIKDLIELYRGLQKLEEKARVAMICKKIVDNEKIMTSILGE